MLGAGAEAGKKVNAGGGAGRIQGSFDSAGASLREVPAPLRMTTFGDGDVWAAVSGTAEQLAEKVPFLAAVSPRRLKPALKTS